MQVPRVTADLLEAFLRVAIPLLGLAALVLLVVTLRQRLYVYASTNAVILLTAVVQWYAFVKMTEMRGGS